MGDARRRSGVGPSGARPANVEGLRVMRMHARKAHAARTFARNLPDEWGDPRISSAFEHVEKVRQKNSISILILIKSHFDRREEVVEAESVFAHVFHLPKFGCIFSSELRRTLK